jgi:hypothetical protein
MRAAMSLVGDPELSGIETAVGSVRSALRLAQEPLGLDPVDDRAGIRTALERWCRERNARKAMPT